MSVIIKIDDDGSIAVESSDTGGVKSYKSISPDALLSCINASIMRGGINSGLLPKSCIAFSAADNGDKDVCILHPENKADITYYGTEYKDFPLPRLVFGFRITRDGRVNSCRLGVVANAENIKPDMPMFAYPLSNVNGFSLCTGNNVLPKCDSLHTLGSLPYFIMSMGNNDDHFRTTNNMRGLGMRELLEHLKDKEPSYYYSDILIPNNMTLADFISGKNC